MHDDFFRGVEAGATVITAGRRLARVLTQSYHRQQREQGRAVWKRPDILPLSGFLSRAWWEHVLGDGDEPRTTLLNASQEQAVWEQVIRESPAGDSLLRIPETARQAMEAWRFVQAYRLPVDGRFEASDDWAAFSDWSRAFRKRCAANQWLEASRLADVVADLFRKGRAKKPARLFLSGFEDLTPQQSDLFDALGGGSAVETSSFTAVVERWRFRESAGEIRAAAAWARRLVEQNPAAQIGVIVPDLARTRAKVERIFREALDPGGTLDDHERSFHVSLGPALDRYPVVRAALLALEFASGRLDLPQAGMLLRSPFLGGTAKEWTRRAQVDVKLRRDGVWDVSPALLRERAGSCLELQRLLARFEKRIRKLPAEQTASGWSREFSKLLEALSWPGDRTLSSREHQVVGKWNELLSNLAALDAAVTPMSFERGLTRLRELATSSPFQVENEGAPVQIMGLLEASGLEFDHLWVTGLHDEALPAAANPNPFLPLSLQREHKLPHSSAERELEFAKKLVDGLLAGAPRVVLSYALQEGDRLLGPSPLIDGAWREAFESEHAAEWVRRVRSPVTITELHDETAPPLAAEATQSGGTSLFKDMAACAFRAFAKHRLGARPLEDSALGLSYRDKGNVAHKALATIWQELGSHARLMELAPEELRELIARGVAAATDKLGPGLGRKLEQRRLERLLDDWLEIEKARDPFTLHALEQKTDVALGGLLVQIRADRVDRLADGREIILDYKTGPVKSRGWEGERPDEPQVPLYCATSSEPIAGAAFALLRTGELGFRGLIEDGVALPAFKEMKGDEKAPLDARIGEWKIVLEGLAEKFREGVAEVDPKSRDTCDQCGLRALCRIREFEHDRG